MSYHAHLFISFAGKHRGLDPELLGFYAHELIDDIQEATAGMFPTPLYPEWDSTKNYLDTGELTGLVTARDPVEARTELETHSLSEACGGSDDGVGADDDEDELPRQTWGTVNGLPQSSRYGAVLSMYFFVRSTVLTNLYQWSA